MKKKSRLKTCKCCGDKFKADPYNAWHQEFCSKKECQRVSHCESSRRYRRKKRDSTEFKEKEDKRVNDWRLRNPKSVKNKKVKKNPEKSDVLRDFVRGEQGVEADVLRDVLLFQTHCFQGFVSKLTGVLRDDIGTMMMGYYDKGKELFPELEKQLKQGVFCHGAEGNHQSGAATEAAGRFRVGGSPPGA